MHGRAGTRDAHSLRTFVSPQSHYMRGIFLDGLSGVRPLATAYSDLEKEAYKKLPVEAYNYVAGGASVQGTMVANRTAFERWQIGGCERR